MKRIFFTFSIICICFYSSTLTAQTIPNDTIGGVDFYTWAPSALTKSLDTTTPISGNNSLKLELSSIGEWWTLQVRLETISCLHIPIDFKAGYSYRMTYKIRSTVPETIIHYCHIAGITDTQQNVSLVGGNVVETKTYITPVLTLSGSSDFAWYWALGYPAVPSTITIDDIVIEELTTAPEGIDEQADNSKFEAYCTSKQLNVRTSVNSKIDVLDLLGRTIAQRNATGNEIVAIPINTSGIVLVKATGVDGITIVRKVIVQ